MNAALQQFPPKEIIYHASVADLPVTKRILEAFTQNEHTRHIRNDGNNSSKTIISHSAILRNLKQIQDEQHDGLSIARHVLEARNIWYLSPSTNVTNKFEIHDQRIKCCTFQQLGPISNGCAYRCQWCYLYGTYRANQPFVTIRTNVDEWLPVVDDAIEKTSGNGQVSFYMGDLLDSFFLAEETGFAGRLIGLFANKPRATLVFLTKDANIGWLAPLANQHNNRTILSWSINAPVVSASYEIRAPSVEQRLRAAAQCQGWGYRVRIRLDPIMPVNGWMDIYRDTIHQIFEHLTPERNTLGTIRFEKGTKSICTEQLLKIPFYQQSDLEKIIERAGGLTPMFSAEIQNGKRVEGKYALNHDLRVQMFRHVKESIEAECRERKIQVPGLGLCKESADVIRDAGFPTDRIACNCINGLFDPSRNMAVLE